MRIYYEALQSSDHENIFLVNIHSVSSRAVGRNMLFMGEVREGPDRKADGKVTVTQITTNYNSSMQKSIS